MVLSIDVERERISLGIKQMQGDPFNNFITGNEKGTIVTGTVKSVDAKGAVVTLPGELEGYLRASEMARDRVEDARTHLKEGDSVTAMIINVDRKNRTINLPSRPRTPPRKTRQWRSPERPGCQQWQHESGRF
jgi:small subunit ribosomal protein S1